ncbi:hypothetical protein ABW21_db0200233 [Orbilia brochopaga]|nr:hypothetical protein ABW21_db0200233 [Drechslerella brochopaga]
MASLGLTDDDGRFRGSVSTPSQGPYDDAPVSPISPHVLGAHMPNQKESSMWGPDVKYIGSGIKIHQANRRQSTNNHQGFYGIHRTNSMSNSSDTGRSQSDGSSRNTSTQTLDSPGNSSPANSPTYYVSHTGNGNAALRDTSKDKVRSDEFAHINSKRIQPALSSRSSDSPTNLSSDFAPHSPPTGFQNRAIAELGSSSGSMRIPRRPLSSTGSTGSGPLHPLVTPNQQSSHHYDSPVHSPRETSRQRQRDSSYSDGSNGHSSESGRPSQTSLNYGRDSSAGPSSRGIEFVPPGPPRRNSEIAAMYAPLRSSDYETSVRPRRDHDIQEHFSPRLGGRSNSFAITPDAFGEVAPFSPDTFGLDLSAREHRPASIASRDSRGEETLKPGESLIYHGKPLFSTVLEGNYDPCELRVYKNSLNEVYRFVTSLVDDNGVSVSTSQQHFKPRELELVPEYGYDPKALPILWFREVEDVNKIRRPLEIMPEKEVPALPVYSFRSVPDMLDFQSAMLSETCYLDIETVRFVRLKGSAKETRRIDNTRVQLWHPAPSDKRTIDDAASFVTVGTTRTHANPEIMRLKWSRMVIYLGRSNDFVTVFITDDITIRQSKKGNTLVFEPTKYTGRALFKSRDGVKAKVVGGGRKKGGVRLDLKGLRPDDEENFPMFKTFEIEFEDAESQVRFLSVWDQLIQERRRMRGIIERRRRLAEERVLHGGGGN